MTGIVVGTTKVWVGPYQIIGDTDGWLIKVDDGTQAECGCMIANNFRIELSLE